MALFAGLLVFATPAWAQRGKDGAGTVATPAPGAVVNAYTELTANAAANATLLSVTSSALTGGAFSTPLAVGDLLMIIQHQGATIGTSNSAAYGGVSAYNSAGRYELVEVRSVPSATSIELACALQYAYSATGKTQVVRVPRYTTLTLAANAGITAPAWNGSTGGVVALEVQGNVVLNAGATIDVSGKGFRGGALTNPSPATISGAVGFVYAASSAGGAEKGESIAGYQTDYDALGGRYGRGAPANGGGGGNNHNAGGGGGANVSTIAWTGKGNPDSNYNTPWSLEASAGANNGGTSTSLSNTTSGGGGRGGYSFSQAPSQTFSFSPFRVRRDPYFTAPGNTGWAGDNRRITGGLGGRPLDVSTERIYFGGGGGAGDQNDGTGAAGATGGGLIYLVVGGSIAPAAAASNTALIANGADVVATTSDGSVRDGLGGGGGGGTIVLNVQGTVATGVTISAAGGRGGNQPYLGNDEAEGPGGGGGGGYVAYTTLGTPSSVSVPGGANGITYAKAINPTNYAFPPNGATSGSSGASAMFTYSAQCLVVADVQTVLSGPATISLGQAITYTVTTTNLSPDIIATNVMPTLTLPAGATNVVLPAGATRVGDVVTFATITTLAPGAGNAVVNTVIYTPAATGTVVASAANTTSSPDPALVNNNGSMSVAQVTTLITAPLPVELTEFTATAVKNTDAMLAWRTASEKNNDHFEVERSLNSAGFVVIGRVKGQGTSTAPTAYALTDAAIGARATSFVYYRLRQVDADGTSSYSPVRTVSFAPTSIAPDVALYPNPAGAEVQLDLTQLPMGTYQVRVLDATGRVVLKASLKAGSVYPLKLAKLVAGTYTVLVRGQNGEQAISLAKRLVKQ